MYFILVNKIDCEIQHFCNFQRIMIKWCLVNCIRGPQTCLNIGELLCVAAEIRCAWPLVQRMGDKVEDMSFYGVLKKEWMAMIYSRLIVRMNFWLLYSLVNIDDHDLFHPIQGLGTLLLEHLQCNRWQVLRSTSPNIHLSIQPSNASTYSWLHVPANSWESMQAWLLIKHRCLCFDVLSLHRGNKTSSKHLPSWSIRAALTLNQTWDDHDMFLISSNG